MEGLRERQKRSAEHSVVAHTMAHQEVAPRSSLVLASEEVSTDPDLPYTRLAAYPYSTGESRRQKHYPASTQFQLVSDHLHLHDTACHLVGSVCPDWCGAVEMEMDAQRVASLPTPSATGSAGWASGEAVVSTGAGRRLVEPARGDFLVEFDRSRSESARELDCARAAAAAALDASGLVTLLARLGEGLRVVTRYGIRIIDSNGRTTTSCSTARCNSVVLVRTGCVHSKAACTEARFQFSNCCFSRVSLLCAGILRKSACAMRGKTPPGSL